MKTLRDKIKALNPEQEVSLKNSYGIFYTGKAKFVFGAVTNEAWNGTHIDVIVEYVYNSRNKAE